MIFFKLILLNSFDCFEILWNKVALLEKNARWSLSFNNVTDSCNLCILALFTDAWMGLQIDADQGALLVIQIDIFWLSANREPEFTASIWNQLYKSRIFNKIEFLKWKNFTRRDTWWKTFRVWWTLNKCLLKQNTIGSKFFVGFEQLTCECLTQSFMFLSLHQRRYANHLVILYFQRYVWSRLQTLKIGYSATPPWMQCPWYHLQNFVKSSHF